jgi:peroxiredoxin
MKIIGILWLLLLSGTLTAQVKVQKGFTLKGHLRNGANSMVYFYEKDKAAGETFYSDSTLADASGKFIFKGVIAEPHEFVLQLKNVKGRAVIYMENANVLVEGNADSLKQLQVKGSKEEIIRQEWALNDPAAQKKWVDELRKKYDAAAERKDTVAMELEQARLSKIYTDSVFKKTRMMVHKYPNSAMIVDVIGNLLIGFEGNYVADSLLKMVERTPAGQFPRTKALRKRLDILLSQTIGSEAPDFIQPDTTGKLISLSSMKGKYVLIDFWASWCSPCRAENPFLLKAYARFKDKGFTILSVSLDGNRKAWLNAVKQDNLMWAQVGDLKAEANEVAKLYAIKAIPANFLIDPQGKIVAKNLRGNQLEKQLEKLF